MKKHYFFKGTEVFLGDTIVVKTRSPFMDGEVKIDLDETTLGVFIKHGMIEVKEEKEEEDTAIEDTPKRLSGSDFDDDRCFELFTNAMDSLAYRLGWKPKKLSNYICNLSSINLSVAFSLVLKEIAVELDKKYEDHISNSEEIYVIDSINGKICKLPKVKKIKNFRNFAAFRSIEDAKIACHILRKYLKYMYK